MRVCYFVSEYPAVPHTFIRREIVELERNNITVLRVSLRRNDRKLVLYSESFKESVETSLEDRAPARQHWSDYVRGVALKLS